MQAITGECFQVLTEKQKEKFQDWIATREGILVWRSQDLSFPRGDMFSPKMSQDGSDLAAGEPPHWAYRLFAHVRILDRFKFVKAYREVGRCKIALNSRLSGMTIVLTKPSSERVRKLQSKFKADLNVPEVFYRFEELEAIFEVPEWEA